MATDARNLPAFFNTDADFQSWCQGLAAQFVIAGMVKTSDTGQINNATVAKPAGTNTAQGYEIYRFSDSLQSGTPIFFKVEYGSAAAVDRPSLWITVGPGSNGSGTITGNTSTRTQINSAVSKTAGVTLPYYCSGDGSRVTLAANYDTTSTSFGFYFTIDRIRDSGGSATTDGVVAYKQSNSSFYSGASIGSSTWTGGAAVTALIGPRSCQGSTPPGAGVRTFNNQIACMPVIVLAGQMRFSASLISYAAADITGVAPSTVQVSNLGSTHTFLPLPSIVAVGNNLIVGHVDDVMMLWE